MLTVDDYGRIRRAKQDGLSERNIAKLFGYSRKTVHKALAQPEPLPYTMATPRLAPG
jgi:transposase